MFYNKVYSLTKKIPKGKISTYKIVAKKLNTKAYRLIGQALKNNPTPIKVPCHRVVNSKGELHGFSGSKSQKSLNKKANLLKKEGIKIKNNKILNFKKVLHKF
tara:strand:- start:413 stop:721 length:309 start_codon:yes stop_codon:yes gene_type:complete